MIEKIAKILYEIDIMKLSSCGAPSDEYVGEAKSIVKHLKPDQIYTVEALESLIYDIFNASFGYGEDLNGNGHYFGVPKTELYAAAAKRIKEEIGS